jgi:hypothetical protein
MQNITLNQFQATIVDRIETILNDLGYFGETYTMQKSVVTYLLNNNIVSGNQDQLIINILSVLFGINIGSIPDDTTIVDDTPTIIPSITITSPTATGTSAGGALLDGSGTMAGIGGTPS